MYCICGVAVGHIGLGSCEFGCLQHLSTRSKLPSHYYRDLMGLSCPGGLRLQRLLRDNNRTSSATLIEILYLSNLHYCRRVAGIPNVIQVAV